MSVGEVGTMYKFVNVNVDMIFVSIVLTSFSKFWE